MPARGYNGPGTEEARLENGQTSGDKVQHEPAPWLRIGSQRLSTWLGERGLTALLVMLVVDLFVLPIFGPDLGQLALDITFSFLLVTGVCALAERRLTRILAFVLAMDALAFRWLERWDASPVTIIGSTAASLSTPPS